jgi:Protein of unknown function (DUF3313)
LGVVLSIREVDRFAAHEWSPTGCGIGKSHHDSSVAHGRCRRANLTSVWLLERDTGSKHPFISSERCCGCGQGSIERGSRRISDSDLNRAKRDLSAQFKKVFTRELTNGGYQVTDTDAPDLLVLWPALVNIQVSAPELMAPGRSATFAESAGQMTLYLEIWDAAKNQILARVTDTRADPNRSAQPMSSAHNWAAANSVLKLWADDLVRELDLAKGKSESH